MKSYERRLECWQCLRCDHLWPKRPGDRPYKCPACGNRLWAVTPTRKKGGGRKKKTETPIPSPETLPARPIPGEVMMDIT